jgi:integrase
MSYFVSYFCSVKRNETQSNAKSFEKVFDRNRQRVRGLWFRCGSYYAQLDVAGVAKKLVLQGADSIPKALGARQDLKNKIAAGEYPPKKVEHKVGHPTNANGTTDHSLAAAITGYRATRDELHQVDVATAAREDSCLSLWSQFAGTKDISEVDSALLLEHAQKRSQTVLDLGEIRRQATAEIEDEDEDEEDEDETPQKRTVGGRTHDMDVLVMGKVLDWAVVNKWLPRKPELIWKKLAKPPKKVRLMTSAELDAFANATLVRNDNIKKLPEKVRRLRLLQATRAQAFSDYIYLIWLSGAREHETTLQKWSNVTWSKPACKGRILFPGEHAKRGGGKPALDRNVDFHSKLENHLEAMYERRDKSTDWMFPSFHDAKQHIGSFRKQKDHAREITGQMDVGFHHGRHYFISHAVMAGVDFKTIAIWVSHRDGGVLIGRLYSHLAPGHSQTQAEKLNSQF